jgi:branched-chain amino acid transport system substrate-binding protein
MLKRLLALSAVLAALASVVGAGSAAPAAPFEIPTIISLTGSGAALGRDEAESIRLLEASVNKSGGVRGRPIAFTIQDDQSSAQVALQLANAIFAKHPPIVIGTTLVSGCSAMLPLIANGPVVYCLSAGMYPPKDSFMFAYGVPTRVALGLSIKFYRERGWKRLAAIDTNDATGQDFEHSLDANLALPENHDVTLVARERFGTSDVSVNAQVANVKAAAPQAMIVWATGNPIGTVFHGMTDLGLDLPTVTSGSDLNYNLMKQLAAFLPKELYFVTVPGVAPDAVPNGPLRSAAAFYFNTLKTAGVPPDSSHLPGWDPGAIVVSALKTLGFDATPAQYRRYIAGLHGFYGSQGEYDFRDGSQHGVDGRSDIVVRYDAATQQFTPVARIGSGYATK